MFNKIRRLISTIRRLNPFRILTERDLGIQELTVQEIVDLMHTKVDPALLPSGDFGRTVAHFFPKENDIPPYEYPQSREEVSFACLPADLIDALAAANEVPPEYFQQYPKISRKWSWKNVKQIFQTKIRGKT